MRAAIGSILIIAGALAGCVTPGPAARTPTAAEIVAADPTATCVKRLNEDPTTLKYLHDTINIGRNAPPTIQMLANTSKPTEEARRQIGVYSNARQDCLSLGASYRRANMPPQVAFQFEQLGENVTRLFVRLYAGEITYGDFNSMRLDTNRGSRAKLIDLDQQTAQAQAAEEVRRQQATAQLLQNAQLQQQVDQQQQYQQQMLRQQQIQMNRPVTTDCSRLGNSVSCTSR